MSAEIRSFLDHVIHGDPALLDELERQVLEERYEVQARQKSGKGNQGP